MLSLFLFLIALFATGDDLNHQVNDYLRKHLGAEVKYEFEIIKAPDNYLKIEVLPQKNMNIQGGIAYIPVSVIRQNNRKANSVLSVKLKIMKEVLVSVAAIGRKEDLNENLFELRMVDIVNVRGKPIRSPEAVKKFRSRVTINPETILTEDMIEPIPEILVGNRVTAFVANGNVLVSLTAVSRQEGSSGETISIVTTNDNRHFKAKIIDSQNVLIIQ